MRQSILSLGLLATMMIVSSSARTQEGNNLVARTDFLDDGITDGGIVDGSFLVGDDTEIIDILVDHGVLRRRSFLARRNQGHAIH